VNQLSFFHRRMTSSSAFTMLQLLKRFVWVWILALGIHHAGAFAFIGPLEAWQIPANGFNPNPFDGLLAGPHNLGEEFRRNTPVMYWACDQNFLDYFGSNGVRAVEQAYSVFNAVSNVSSYSLDLSEWPLESQRHNFEAQALNLYDVRSFTMQVMMEQLGLSQPERYTYVLHNRAAIPNAPPCPDGMDYLVVKRNFDPVPSPLDQFQTSSYVNGTLYSYGIFEICTAPFPPIADAFEVAVDREAHTFTTVASYGGLDLGGFYLSLTRDDIGGMRYLFRTNNMNIENTGPGTVEFVTNNTPQLIFGSDLSLLAAQALTNDAAALQALFPGLIISSTSNIFTVVTTTNVVANLVPGPPWAPAGTFQLIFTTNFVRTPQLQFIHTFANLVTFQFINGRWVTVPLTSLSQASGPQIVSFQTTSVTLAAPPFAPANTLAAVTNTTSRLRIQLGPVGEFFILGTNNFCDIQVLSTVLTNIVPVTNILASGTNTTVGGTNGFPGQVLQSSLSVVTFFTNHAFVILPVTCPGTNTALFQGIERVSFIRHDFDSLLGRFFQPVTNDYVLNEITNGVVNPRSIRRIITQPDFLFSAADLDPGPATIPFQIVSFVRNLNFNAANALPGLAGPGTIEPSTTITFNKGLPIFENFRLDPTRFLDELSQFPNFAWGSFDGTTNPPVVYPNGTSIANLENLVLLPITPDNLPLGKVGVPYSQHFSSPGGQPPFTVSLAPGSDALPPGLTLASDGTLSGTPTSAGTYEFTIQLADSGTRVVNRLFTLVITP
jgi:hypothetical protein